MFKEAHLGNVPARATTRNIATSNLIFDLDNLQHLKRGRLKKKINRGLSLTEKKKEDNYWFQKLPFKTAASNVMSCH